MPEELEGGLAVGDTLRELLVLPPRTGCVGESVRCKRGMTSHDICKLTLFEGEP